jgi:hypothetical protein
VYDLPLSPDIEIVLQCPQCQKGQMRRIGILPADAATAGWNSS